MLHRLPEGQLSRGELPAGWGFTVIVLDRWFLDDGIWLQVGQLSQLRLAEAVVAQAFHDAADLWSRSQGTVGSTQCAGSGRRWPTGDDLSLVAHLEAAVGVFEDFYLHTGVAGTLRARQQLQGASLVLDRVVPSHLPGVLEGEDLFQGLISVPPSVGRLGQIGGRGKLGGAGSPVARRWPGRWFGRPPDAVRLPAGPGRFRRPVPHGLSLAATGRRSAGCPVPPGPC